MKKLYVLALLAFSYFCSFSQVLYTENFDSYTNNAKVAQTLGNTWWTTWSNAPGGAEDAVFSNAQSSSQPLSIYVAGSNDLVFKTGSKTTGRYSLSWKMFVPTGRIGYFNLLQSFAGNNSVWGFQAYIYNDSIYVDAGSTTPVGKQFSRNVWHDIKLIIDLDDDYATFFLDGNEVTSYQWSKGAFGNNNLVKLDAINFYAWDGTQSPTPITGGSTKGYYVDNLLYEQTTAPNAPTNLTATLNGANVDLNWTAPTPTPTNYKLMRNGIVIYNTSSNTSYTDMGPWPNTYNYVVRAGYGSQGYSHASNTATIQIPGGVNRNLVLFEKGTGTWCQYCPGAAMGLRDLIDVNQKNATAIAYHYGDSYEIIDATQRLGYYAVEAFPTTFADGVLVMEGGNATQSLYPYFLNMYNQRTPIPGLQNINVNIVGTGLNTYSATITVEETYPYLTTGLKLHTALTESNIPQNWQNQTEVDFVLRKMYPDAAGTNLDFSQNMIQTYQFNIDLTGFVKNNCEFVAFVQHDATKEVTQTVAVKMSTVTGYSELNGYSIGIYPNPASDYITINSNGNGTLTISDLTGKQLQVITVTKEKQLIPVNMLSKGIYILTYTTNNNSIVEKLIVN
ncbi:MAG: T9SS type A sorting domain-containing protein [Bacteroidales bacterium]|nr:T9SS type A sorting domain-containing protein [Bacteroidales bacterium]